MSEGKEPTEAVRRVLFRDDLLTLAAEADRIVGIVRRDEALTGDQTLFGLALERHLRLAREHAEWALQAQAWNNAAVLVRFGDLVGTALAAPRPPEEMHEQALQSIANDHPAPGTEKLDKDLTHGVIFRYHAARDLRLAGQYDAAMELVERPVTELYGKGAEPYMANYLYEEGAIRIAQGHSAQVDGPFERWRGYWETTRAADYSTRHRFDYIRALALWDADPDDARIMPRLEAALGHLRLPSVDAVPVANGILPNPEEERGLRELSVRLAMAEYLAGREHTEETCARAVELGERALEITDKVRTRWRVIARSLAPLAMVFQRVYGDLALLASRLPGQSAAEFGFKVALSAKQTGFATRIRDGRTFTGNPRIDRILQDILATEADTSATLSNNPSSRRHRLEERRAELADAVTPMLADTVFPSPKPILDLLAMIGSRYVLDFVELPDTLENEPRLFRTLIEPDSRMSFETFRPGAAFRAHFERGRVGAGSAGPPARPPRRGIRDADVKEPDAGIVNGQVDWRALAEDVLPPRLTDRILPQAHSPITLLISAHSWLSLLPWAALKIDAEGTRLVERAVISQCPVLACLSQAPPPVAGRALIRLVGTDEAGERGVNVALERRAWGLAAAAAGNARLYECGLLPGDQPEPYGGRFDEAIAEPDRWQFLHIASHGGGEGFDQFLDLPGEPLSAAGALGFSWPASVLMASCHVGLVVNEAKAEPLNFVMALLTGGARCVVAGIDSVEDLGTGRAAGRMVGAVRDPSGGVSLDVALRGAQLAAIRDRESERGWAYLSAYVR